MSDSEEELIRGMYELFDLNASDEEIRELANPDVEWYPPPNSPEPGPFRGYGGLRKLTGYFAESFEEFSPEVDRVIPTAEAGKYVVFSDTHVRGKGSGVEVTAKVAHLIELRDGKLARFRVFPDRDDGLRAAGLDPADFT